jgi:hypothetical protein
MGDSPFLTTISSKIYKRHRIVGGVVSGKYILSKQLFVEEYRSGNPFSRYDAAEAIELDDRPRAPSLPHVEIMRL